MGLRRVLTDRWLGGLAVLSAVILAAVGAYGFAGSIGEADLVVFAAPVAAAALLTAVVLWLGGAFGGSRRTPYW